MQTTEEVALEDRRDIYTDVGIARVQGVEAGGLRAISIMRFLDFEEHTSEDWRFEELHKFIDLN